MADIVNLEAHLIGTPSTGVNLYQVPNASMEVFQDIINATWNLANSKDATAVSKATAIKDMIDGILAAPGAFHVTPGTVDVPVITAPSVTIPSTASAVDLYSDFHTEYLALASWLDDKFTSFRTTYFPDEGALYTAAESSLSDALASGSYIPATVQSQIWGDDQARIIEDKLRAQDSVVASFASRRFPLTPDVAAAAVLQIEQKAQDELAESSRKIAIMSVEQYKWVIDNCMKLRGLVLSAANDYVKSLASGPDVASRLIPVGWDAQQKLISAAADFYRADTAAKDVISKVHQYNNSIALDGAAKNQAVDAGFVDTKVKAFLSELQFIMQEATALFNNLHASVSMSAGGTSVTTQAQSL